MMAWYDQYDLEEDPFIEPVETTYGLEDTFNELSYRIESGSMVYVEGKPGSGKTSLLKSLARHFGGRGKVIYFDCGQVDRKVNIEKLMMGKYSFFDRLAGSRPKDMILLLDNANVISKKNCERIKYYFDNNYAKAVVFSGASYARAHFSHSVRDRIGGRIIKLKELTAEQASSLVNERAPDVKLFSDELLKKVFRLSGKNVKQFLANLSSLADKAVAEGADKVSENHVKEVFGDGSAR